MAQILKVSPTEEGTEILVGDILGTIHTAIHKVGTETRMRVKQEGPSVVSVAMPNIQVPIARQALETAGFRVEVE